MNLFVTSIAGRVLSMAANNLVKTVGTAVIVFGTSRLGFRNNNPVPQITPSNTVPIEVSSSSDDYTNILKGDTLNTAILPLRKTEPAEIDQILVEALDMHFNDINYSASSSVSNTAKNLVKYIVDMTSNTIFNRKKFRLSDSDIVIDGPGHTTPGLTIQVQKASEVYKQSQNEDKILSLHLTLENAARVGLLLKLFKFILYILIIWMLWGVSIWLLRQSIKRINSSKVIDVDYKSFGSKLNDIDSELMQQRKIYLNPANCFKHQGKQ
nr:hypothetical protein [Gracilaria tikvahiae]